MTRFRMERQNASGKPTPPKQPGAPHKPTPITEHFELPRNVRQKLGSEVINAILSRVRGRVEEVLDQAGSYGSDHKEMRWQICACIADDLRHGLGKWVEQILEECWPATSKPEGGFAQRTGILPE